MSNKSSFVPCLAWIRRGVAKAKPEEVVVTQEELKKIIDETKEELGEMRVDTNVNLSEPSSSGVEAMETDHPETDDIIDRYGFNDYEDSDEDGNDPSNPLPSIGGLTYYTSNDEDPYITLKGRGNTDSDDEDNEIKPDDNILAAARVKENENIIEFFIYNEANDDLYVHHDILLTHFPLSIEWMDYKSNDGGKGNFVAVGSMEPVIEIWDVDVINALEPCHVLGEKKLKNKKSKKKSKGHTDAVLDLSWNAKLRNVLASASADHTVALWDLEKSSVVKTLTKHTDKVQTLAWHSTESQTLLSGGFDKMTIVYDCRDPDDANRSWQLNGEVERVLWNHFQPSTFFMSTDQGFVYMADMRSDKVLFTLSAHVEACTGLAMSCSVPDILVTVSSDQTAKVWDIANNAPKVVHEQNLKQGEVHCVASCPDAPFIFAAGCQKDMKVWNWKNNKAVAQQFENRVIKKSKALNSKSSK